MNIYQQVYLNLINEEKINFELRQNIIKQVKEFISQNNLNISLNQLDIHTNKIIYIKILTDKLFERVKILKQIQLLLQKFTIVNIQYTSLSSAGNLNLPEIKVKIFIKPNKSLSISGAGLANQKAFEQLINNLNKNDLKNIKFIDKNNREIIYNNIITAVSVGTQTKDKNKNQLKADIHLLTNNNQIYKISLKNSNAEFFGMITQIKNTETYKKYENILKNCQQNALLNKQLNKPYLIKTSQNPINYKISQDIAWKETDINILKELLFGTDIQANDCIIYGNFEILNIDQIIYDELNNIYIIPVEELIFPNDQQSWPEIYWVIMNKTFRSGVYPGIWCRACIKNRAIGKFDAENL